MNRKRISRRRRISDKKESIRNQEEKEIKTTENVEKNETKTN